MDNRTQRTKKKKSRNVRPYDRPNQSILGRVASKVKGLFNPSWILNVSQWMGTSEESENPGSSGVAASASTESSLINTESPILMNGDDHSENSEASTSGAAITHQDRSNCVSPNVRLSEMALSNLGGGVMSLKRRRINDSRNEHLSRDDNSENSEESASTSGCSSLVSHKDRLNSVSTNVRLSEMALKNLGGELKNVMSLKRRRMNDSQNEHLSPNTSGNRISLWSSGLNTSATRSPVARTNQPSFNVSAFVAPSKLSQQQKVSSPFYQGRTTFGGASSIRRMPINAAPYQIDKSLRSQIKVKSNQSHDTLEGMSSAAKRILQTLETMSSPVMDAKKIPNTNKSPVDLSLYLKPPKHRIKLSTPNLPSKGPPIANISSISKLTNLKSFRDKKLQNSYLDSPPITNIDALATSVQKTIESSKVGSGGGKMRNKLNLHHVAPITAEPVLPDVTLPTIPQDLLPSKDFTIRHEKMETSGTLKAPESSGTNKIPPLQFHTSTLDVSSEKLPKDDQVLPPVSTGNFVFSNPIVHEVFISNQLNQWECDTCMLRNSLDAKKCVACTTLRPNRKYLPSLETLKASPRMPDSLSKFSSPMSMVTTTATESTFKFRQPAADIAASTLPSSLGAGEPKSTDPDTFKPISQLPDSLSKFSSPVSVVTTTAAETTFEFRKPITDTSARESSETSSCTASADGQKAAGSEKSKASPQLPDSLSKFSSNSPVFTTNVTKTTLKMKPATDTAATSFTLSSTENPKPSGTPDIKAAFGLSMPTTSTSTVPVFTFSAPASTTTSGFSFGTNSTTSASAANFTFGSDLEKTKANPQLSDSLGKFSPVSSVTTTGAEATFKFGQPATDISSLETMPSSASDRLKGAGSDTSKASLQLPDSLSKFSSPLPVTTGDAQETTFKFKHPATDTAATCFTLPSSTSADELKPSGFTFKPPSEAKPTSVFPSANTPDVKPAFNFGVPATSTSTVPVFTFGASAATTSASGFSFVANTATTTPASNFTFGPAADTLKVKTPLSSSLSFTAVSTAPAPAATFKFVQATTSTTTSSNTLNSEEAKPPGFIFKNTGAETKNTFFTGTSSNTSDVKPVFAFGVPATSTSTTQPFKFSASAPSTTSSGFTFGSIPAPTSSLAFGAAPSSTSNTSGFSGFQPSQPSAPAFQFTGQPAKATNPAFGNPVNSFTFAAKTETPAQISAAPVQTTAFGSTTPFGNATPAQTTAFGSTTPFGNPAPATAFGSTTPFGNTAASVQSSAFGNTTPFGNTATPAQATGLGGTTAPFGIPLAFGEAKKSSSGFNFTSTAPNNPAFQCKNLDKPVAPTQFGFGAAAEQNSSFAAAPFNIVTPSSFNFAAMASPAPFHFAANNNNTESSSAAPRKIRKALRRGLRKE